MNKKISIGIAIAIAAVVGAICFSVAYFVALGNAQSAIRDFTQRQAMFSLLAETDSAVRDNYVGTIDEAELSHSTVEGYISALDPENVAYVTAQQLTDGDYKHDENTVVVRLSDGSAVVFYNTVSTADEANR